MVAIRYSRVSCRWWDDQCQSPNEWPYCSGISRRAPPMRTAPKISRVCRSRCTPQRPEVAVRSLGFDYNRLTLRPCCRSNSSILQPVHSNLTIIGDEAKVPKPCVFPWTGSAGSEVKPPQCQWAQRTVVVTVSSSNHAGGGTSRLADCMTIHYTFLEVCQWVRFY